MFKGGSGSSDGGQSDISGDRTFEGSILGDPDPAVDTVIEADLDFFATARARIGGAFDRLHVYATGGAAIGEINTEYLHLDPVTGDVNFSDDTSETHWGATVGAGAEFAVTNNIIIGLEYLYLHFFEEEHAYLIDGDSTTTDVDLSAHVVRGAVSVKF